MLAGMAQLVEQLIHNEQVVGSSPTTSLRSRIKTALLCGLDPCFASEEIKN